VKTFVSQPQQNQRAGALLLLQLGKSGYSPDLSPIEPGWAKVKSYLRRIAARTVEALQQALAPALDSITAQDAAGFFRHCGYACPN
jgi:transposase